MVQLWLVSNEFKTVDYVATTFVGWQSATGQTWNCGISFMVQPCIGANGFDAASYVITNFVASCKLANLELCRLVE